MAQMLSHIERLSKDVAECLWLCALPGVATNGVPVTHSGGAPGTCLNQGACPDAGGLG
jgi:hypothetical protein